MNQRKPFKIEIFLSEGIPNGLRLVEKSSRDVLCIVCPQGRYPHVKSRDEFSKSGVYLLVGQDGDSLPKLYVGESEKVRDRLNSHYADKDFWQQAIIFTTRDTPLNKAEIKFLESRLLELAKESGRSKLENSGESKRPKLSESDEAVMEELLDELLLLLPVLGLTLFQRPETPSDDSNVYHLSEKGLDARGIETDSGFLVLKGSLAHINEKESMKKHIPSYYRLRRELIDHQTLRKIPNGYEFATDWLFDSPSAVAAVCYGGNTRAFSAWKDSTGTSLKDNRTREAGSSDSD